MRTLVYQSRFILDKWIKESITETKKNFKARGYLLINLKVKKAVMKVGSRSLRRKKFQIIIIFLEGFYTNYVDSYLILRLI